MNKFGEDYGVLSTNMRDEIESLYLIDRVFRFGSHVYGSNDENSDEDFIVLVLYENPVSTRIEIDNQTVHVYTMEIAQKYLNNHDVSLIETQCKYGIFGDFKIDLGKLRSSFSAVANNSWVKGKKKLEVPADYDLRGGLKSIFHSIRIMDYGVQIATHGTIKIWDNYNWLLKELNHLGETKHITELWEIINSRYLETYKQLKSEFRGLIPKNLMETGSKKQKIITILKHHKINPSKSLLKELMDV